MTNPVKAVTPDALFIPLVWPRIDRGGLRHRHMEGRVEYGHLRHLGTEDSLRLFDRLQLQAIVFRREFTILADSLPYLLRNPRGPLKSNPAMHYPMADYP